MDLEQRIEYFNEELSLITSELIKEFTIACLGASPDYVFEDCPSSSTGKFHPIDELGADGTLIHTKKVFAMAYELSTGLDCVEYRDEICAAALLHDMAKQGLIKSRWTAKDHPQIMAKLIIDIYSKDFKDRITKDAVLKIYYGVFYHYGPWTDASVRKPLADYKPWELSVYLADYVSSKRFVHVNSYKKILEVL